MRLTCPRCGRPATSVFVREIKGRKYVYISHYLKKDEGGPKYVQHSLGSLGKAPDEVIEYLLGRGLVSREEVEEARAASKPSGPIVELTPEEVEAFYVKVVEKVGKAKYDPKKHRGLSWEEINEAWASLKSKVLALRDRG